MSESDEMYYVTGLIKPSGERFIFIYTSENASRLLRRIYAYMCDDELDFTESDWLTIATKVMATMHKDQYTDEETEQDW